MKIRKIFCGNPRIIFVLFYDVHKENIFTINLGDGCEAPSKARKKGAKRLEFLVLNKNLMKSNHLSWKVKLLSFQNHRAQNLIRSLLTNFHPTFMSILIKIFNFWLSWIRLVSSILHHCGCTAHTKELKYVLETKEWVLSEINYSLLKIYKPILF